MKKFYISFIVIVTIGSFIIYLFSRNSNQLLSEYGLKGLSVTEMVESLEAQTINRDDMVASISATQLIISTDNYLLTFNVPDNLFYLSFAPYLETTHPCGTHNLVTCRGELKNQEFEVVIIDNQNNILINEVLISHDNGFVGVWLPRGIIGEITVTFDDMSITKAFQTFDNSNTCLTDLKLIN